MNKLFTLLILLLGTQVSSARVFYFDFEAEDGYELGPLLEQNNWDTFPNIPDQPTVDNSQPSDGLQHARISKDNQAMAGDQSGAFSPSFGFRDDDLSPSVHVDLYFSALDGAAYDVLAQSIFQNLITWRVRFTNTGDILIFDSPGGANGFYDSGVDYPVGSYFTLYVETLNPLNRIDYYLDGQLIYSSTGGVPFGNSVEQIVFISNNQHADDNEFMAFDRLYVNTDNVDFIFADGFEPTQE